MKAFFQSIMFLMLAVCLIAALASAYHFLMLLRAESAAEVYLQGKLGLLAIGMAGAALFGAATAEKEVFA